jgi:hypothetical protein
MHVFFDKRLRLAQKLCAEKHDRCGAVTDFGVLRERDVHERLGCRVHDVEKVHDRGAVVRNRRLVARVDELVHAARPERRAHGLHHGLARVNVADQLRFALACVRALLEQNNLRLLLASSTNRIIVISSGISPIRQQQQT